MSGSWGLRSTFRHLVGAMLLGGQTRAEIGAPSQSVLTSHERDGALVAVVRPQVAERPVAAAGAVREERAPAS